MLTATYRLALPTSPFGKLSKSLLSFSMARPSQRFKTLRAVSFWIMFFASVFPGCAAALIIFLLVSPYHVILLLVSFGPSQT